MPTVAMPDGTNVSFPDDMPADQIKSLIATKFPNEVKGLADKPSFSRMVTDIPGEFRKGVIQPLVDANNTLNPFSAGFQKRIETGEPVPFLETGKALASPLVAAYGLLGTVPRAVGGNALALGEEALRKGAVALYGEDKVPPAQGLEAAKGNIDLLMGAVGSRVGTPVKGLSFGQQGPVRPPNLPPAPNGPLGVTLSEGQATGDLAAIQREQAALRAPSGRAGERAREFSTQQQGQVASARDRIAEGFDPFQQRIVETPQEAGQLVQQSIQREAASRKAGVTQAYDEAKALPGEVKADAFRDIGTSIKTDLSARPDPIVIDDKLTPFASHAIRDVEQRIANLQIQNRASPTGQPPQNQIAGVTLEGVDQMRKRLVAFRKDAYGSGNSADGRAASGVVDAFDAHIDRAINSGQFVGDQRAIQAWNNARAAHADYRATFGKGKNDPVGRVMERIIGTRDNPAAIPNDVADFLYGSSGINPNSLNVAVANRAKSILGEASPEWSAVKQGLFSRMVETPAGVTDMGPGKIAQRVNRFLSGDGREMANAVFSPVERGMIQQFADLHRRLEVPQAGANWSNTSTFLKPLMEKISGGLAAVIGGAIGHAVAPGSFGVAEALSGAAAAKASGAVKGMGQARQIIRQMPLVQESAQKYQRALMAYNRANTPATSAALQVAITNLARSLQHIGVDLTVQGPAVGRAEDQPGVPRPPGQ